MCLQESPAGYPARLPNQPCPRLASTVKMFSVLAMAFSCQLFTSVSVGFLPAAGQILRTQNLKSKPQRRAALSSQTAAIARNGLTALAARPLFFRAFSSICFHDLEELLLHHPETVLQSVAHVNRRVVRRLVVCRVTQSQIGVRLWLGCRSRCVSIAKVPAPVKPALLKPPTFKSIGQPSHSCLQLGQCCNLTELFRYFLVGVDRPRRIHGQPSGA
jgi:hypothetical protein